MVRRVRTKECSRLCKTSAGLLGWLVAWLGLDRSAYILAERITGPLMVLREAAYFGVSAATIPWLILFHGMDMRGNDK